MKLSRRLVGSAIFFSMGMPLLANPTGADVVKGAAKLNGKDGILNVVTATKNTVINWNTFSVGHGEITNFIQPGMNSAVLNRVIGSMPSEIAGQLLSNGRVALLNSNGIAITSSGVIDTRGFTASTLDLNDDEFSAQGALHFSGSSEAAVSNAGRIIAREGDVFLLGQTVANSGRIGGKNVALAAGSAVTLKKAGDGRLSVEVPTSGKNSKVTNTGSIKAIQGRLRDSGGNPYALGMNVDHGAEATPDSFSSGQVVMTSGRGSTEAGGSIAAGNKARGGRIDITGKSVTVKSGAKIDASGDSAGGTVKIGGGFQGNDATITNAEFTQVEFDASITADTRVSGNGGKVTVWSDNATDYNGAISAQGGTVSGDGGFVEVSGKQLLGFHGTVSTIALHGATGTLLLDPANITITDNEQKIDSNTDSNPNPNLQTFFGVGNGNGSNDSRLAVATLVSALASNDVTVTTTNSANNDAGTITVAKPITWLSGNVLTLRADSNIVIDASITNLFGAKLVLQANGANVNVGRNIDINANIELTGSLSATAKGSINQNASLSLIKVDGLSKFDAGSNAITLDNGLNKFGNAVTLTGGTTDIRGDSGLTLGVVDTGKLTAIATTGTLNLGSGNIVGSLTATGSAGPITNDPNATLTVTGTANFSGSTITLGNQLTDTMNFGKLTFDSAGAVWIETNLNTRLTGVSNGLSLVLNSTGTITIDSTANLTVTNTASFSGTSITLGTTTDDTINVGSLTFNSAGAVTIKEDSDMLLTGTNTASALTLSAAGTITDATRTSVTVTSSNLTATGAITLNDTATDVLTVTNNASFSGSSINVGSLGAANFGSLTFNSGGGIVGIQEDSDMLLTGTNTASALTLGATGTITDATGTRVTVTSSNLTATGAITLNDAATDVLTVTNDASFSGSSINVGSLGAANFGSLSFNSGGIVGIQEDSGMLLTGTNTASVLTLGATGFITDATGTSVTVTSSNLTATGAITLNDTATDVLTVTNNASFSGSSISVGSLGAANFGSLTFNSGGGIVGIQEDSDMLLTGTNTAGALTLGATGTITDATGTSVTATSSNLTATGAITLNDTATDVLTVTNNASFSGSSIHVGSLGAANFGSLTFNSGGIVSIQEDSNTTLSGTSTGLSMVLNSTGAITNDSTASLTVTNNAKFIGKNITLGNQGTGDKMFFGSLTLTGEVVIIDEDDSTGFEGISSVHNLTLTTPDVGFVNLASTLTANDGNAVTRDEVTFIASQDRNVGLGGAAGDFTLGQGDINAITTDCLHISTTGAGNITALNLTLPNKIDSLSLNAGTTGGITISGLVGSKSPAGPDTGTDFAAISTNGSILVSASPLSMTGNILLKTTGTGGITVDAATTAGGIIELSSNGSLSLTANAVVTSSVVGSPIKLKGTDLVLTGYYENLVADVKGTATLNGVSGNSIVVLAENNIIGGVAAVDVIANRLVLSAQNGNIGGSGAAVVTQTGTLSTLATKGSTYVSEQDALKIIDTTFIKEGGLTLDNCAQVVSGGAIVSDTVIGAQSDVNTMIVAGGTLTVNSLVVGKTGDVLLNTTASDIILNANVEAGRHASVVAAGKVDQNFKITSTKGGDIYVQAKGGDITMAGGTNSTSNGGSIRYQASGNVDLRNLSAAGHSVSVVAGLNITDADLDESANITASLARLSAGGSIGSAAGSAADTNLAALDLAVGNLEAIAGQHAYLQSLALAPVTLGLVGSVPINVVGFDGVVTITNDADLTGVTATAGVAKLKSAGTVTIAETYTAGTDALILTTAGDVVLNADVNAGGNASVISAGKVDQHFNITSTNGDIYVQAQGGDVTMDAGKSTTANGGGNIRYQASGNVALGHLIAAGDAVSVVAGNNITDANLNETANITAARARLSAGGSIGAGGGTQADLNLAALDLVVDNLEAVAGQNAYLQSLGMVSVGGVGDVATKFARFDSGVSETTPPDANLTGMTATNGVAKLKSAGTVTVAETYTAGADALILTTAGDVALNADVNSGGHASVIAAGKVDQHFNITSTAGDIFVQAVNGDVTMDSGTTSAATVGNIRYQSNTGNVALGHLTAVGHSVSVKAFNNITDADLLKNVVTTANITSARARLEAVTGSIGGATLSASDTNPKAIDIKTDKLEAIAKQNIYLESQGPVAVGTVGDVTTQFARFDSGVSATTDVNLTGATATNGVAKLKSVGAVTVAETYTAGTDALILTTTGDVVLNADVNAGGNASVIAAGKVEQHSNITSTFKGDIYVQAVNGDVKMDSGTTSEAKAGNISYQGSGDVALGLLSAVANQISVVAGGNISDAQNDTVSHDVNGFATNDGVRAVNATASVLRLTANGDIGTANDPLDTDVTTLALSSGGSSSIYETGALQVGPTGTFTVKQVHFDSVASDVIGANLSDATAGKDLKIETLSGGDLEMIGAPTVGGDLLLAAGKNLILDKAITVHNGNATLLAQSNLNLDVNVTADTGSVVLGARDGKLSMTDGTKVSAGKDIHAFAFNYQQGADNLGKNVTVGLLSTTHNVSIEAGGDILDARADKVDTDEDGFAKDASGPDRTVNVDASGLVLKAGGDIGADGNPLDTSVTTLALSSKGSSYIYESDGLVIGLPDGVKAARLGMDSTVTPVGLAMQGAEAKDGHLKIETISGNFKMADTTISAGQDIHLAAGNGGALIFNSGSTTAAGHDASLLARAGIFQNGNVTVGGTLDIEAFGGNYTMSAGATAVATGDVRVSASNSVTLGVLRSDANVSVEATAGSILDGQSDHVAKTGLATEDSRTVNLTGNGVQLKAGGTIGTTSNPLDIKAVHLAATAGDSIHLFESNALEIDTPVQAVVNRVSLDSPTSAIKGLKISGIVTPELSLIAGRNISQSPGASVNNSDSTLLESIDGDIKLTDTGNEFKTLEVRNGVNVSVRDNDGGLTMTGSNRFTGDGFVVVTENGLRFETGTTLDGPGGSNAVFIAGSVPQLPGVNEFNSGDPLEGRLEVKDDKTNLYIFANSLATTNSPSGSNLTFVSQVDQINFDFSFSSSGDGSVDTILDEFGSTTALGLSGGARDTVNFLSSAPYIDLTVPDVAELARDFVKSVLKETQPEDIKFEPAPREALALGDEAEMFGPFLTTGYEYLTYESDKKTKDKLFPLYIDYVKDKDGNWVMKNLFDKP